MIPVITEETSSLHDAMRRLWAEDVIWTREYIVEAVAGAPDAAQAAAERLLKNQEDIGNAFVPFYGEEMGACVTDLLKSHVQIAVDLVNAAVIDDERQFRREERRWNDNAAEIAAFLSEANPCWPEKDVQDLLSRELSFTKRELGARFEEDWECDVEYFDDMFTQILTMADVLSEGLVSQFPDRFDHPGSRQAREGEPNAMEIEEIPRTFSLRLTEQELTTLTEVVGSWIDNSKGEDPAVETMYQQLSDALGDEAAEVPEVPEKTAEEEAVDEEE